MPSTSLIYEFLGIDAGAGAQFDRMAKKTTALGMTSAATKKAVLGLGVAAGIVGVASVKAAAQFQTSMRVIQTQAGASSAELQRMSKAMLALAGPTATAPDELAKGLFHLESAGLRGARAVDAMRVAAEGAKLGGANLEDVTNALNAAISSGISGVHDMSQAMGYLNATVGEGDMRMQDLADALGTGVLAVVKGFGVSMRDASAALAVFGDNNIRGAQAGTDLRVMVQSLTKPVATGTAVLKALGLQTDSLAKAMQHGGLNAALQMLKRHMDAAGVSGNQVGQVITDAFGKKSSAPLAILIGQMGRFDQKFRATQEGAHGFASSWAGYTKTFGYSFDRMRVSVQVLAIKLGNVLMPIVTRFANFVTNNVLPAVEGIAHWFQENRRVIGPLAKTLAEFVIVAKAVSLAMRAAAVASALFAGKAGVVVGAATAEAGALEREAVAARSLRLGFIGVGLAAFQAWQYTRQSNERSQAKLTQFASVSTENLRKVEAEYLKVAYAATQAHGTLGKLLNEMVGQFRGAISDVGGDMESLASFAQFWGAQAAEKFAQGFYSVWSGIKAPAAPAGGYNFLIHTGTTAKPKTHHSSAPMGGGGGFVIPTGGGGSVGSVGSIGGGSGGLGGVGSSGSKASTEVWHRMQGIGKLLAQGLLHGWTGEAGKLRSALPTSVQNALDHLTAMTNRMIDKQVQAVKAARKRLASTLGQRKSDIANLASSLAPDLSGAFQSDQFGNTVLGNLGSFEQSQAVDLKKFAADLKWAAAHHLNAVSLGQIAQMGAAQGEQLLQQLMTGGTAIAALNASQAQITRYAAAAAKAAIDPGYARRIAQEHAEIRHQTSVMTQVRDEVRAMRRQAARTIGRTVVVMVDQHGALKGSVSPEEARIIQTALNKLERTKGRKKS